ncbi:MAG: T9SS type A sorting domain-containing protein [Bacteroidia bacterium]|nr:T9SS type A sorting domain-containing protein [Bacteroidia bacterium]
MNTNYPVNPAGHLINAFLNGYSFALSTFTPVIYNPVTGSLEYYKKVTVHISTCPDNQASEALSSIPSSENALRRVRLFAQNGSMMDREFEPGAQRWVHYDCNVLGDPALKVWTGNTAAGLVHDNLYADFKLSPNPATVNIILSFTLEVNSRCKVTITNSLGQPLLSRSAVEYPPGTHAISMNINGLADGLYFCRFENAQGGATRKIVVMR